MHIFSLVDFKIFGRNLLFGILNILGILCKLPLWDGCHSVSGWLWHAISNKFWLKSLNIKTQFDIKYTIQYTTIYAETGFSWVFIFKFTIYE